MKIASTLTGLSGFQELSIDASGFKTRCLVAGSREADVVLLLHDAAFGGTSDLSWEATIPSLSRRYRIIAPDLLGFGGSDKAIFFDRSPYDFRNSHVLSVVDALAGPVKIHLIGNSFGGSMGLHMLRTHPDRLRSVLSIAGAAGGWRTEHGLRVLGSWDGTREGLATISAELAVDSPEFDFRSHVDRRYEWAQKDGHYRAVVAPSAVLPSALISGTKRDPFPPIGDCDVPVLLLAGTEDKLVEPDWPEQLAKKLPKRCAIQRMNSRHSPNLDHPAKFNSIAADWISEN